MMWAGIASVHLNANADAVAWLRRSIEANRNFPLAHFHFAAALALLGSLDEARAAAQAGLALNSGFTTRRFRRQTPSNNPTYLAKRERTLEGMRMAGVPEG
jgi:hypothetical protein